MPVISEIFSGQRLGGENDLAGVLCEVFYDRINQLENSLLLMLNRDRLGEPAGRQQADDLPGLLERCFEPDLQLAASQAAELGELSSSIASISLSADTANNPLLHVPTKMQNEIANRILVGTHSDPKLLVRQPANTVYDPRPQQLQPVTGKAQEQTGDCFRHGRYLIKILRACVLRAGATRN